MKSVQINLNLHSHRYRCCNIVSAYPLSDVTASARHRWINCFRTRKARAHEVASSMPFWSFTANGPEFISWSNPNKAPPSNSLTWLLFTRAFTARLWICRKLHPFKFLKSWFNWWNQKMKEVPTFNSTVTFLYAPGYVRTGWWTYSNKAQHSVSKEKNTCMLRN